MQFIRHASDCAHCPLRDRPRVPGTGPADARIAILGESPGSTESAEGRPFCGPAGKVLDAGLAGAKIDPTSVYRLNLINCQPPDNDLGSLEGQEALERCRPGFDAEVTYLVTHGTKVVVAAGAKPMAAVGIPGSIGKVRGSVYEWRGVHVVATYHPSFINRMRYDKGGGKADLQWTWVSDLAKAARIASDGWRPPREDFTLYPTREQVLDTLERHTGPVAVDIETTSLDPATGKIAVVGLGFDTERALSVPFVAEGRPYWSPIDEEVVKEALGKFLSSRPLVFQNALFDVRWLRHHGYTLGPVLDDTLLLHHAVCPELPHTLDFIVSVYGATPYWKGDKGRVGTREGFIYNLRDAVVLWQVLPELRAEATAYGVEAVYRNESLALIDPVIEMMNNGVAVDTKRLREWKRYLEEKASGLERTLRRAGRLPDAFNLSSDEDLRWFLFRQEPAKFGRLGALPTKKAGTKIHAELTALASVRDATTPLYTPSGFGGRKTDGGRLAVNKQGLLSYQVFLQNRLETVRKFSTPRPDEVAAIEATLKWLATFHDYSETMKLLTTYTDLPVARDGRLHTSFKIHGTATGRLSSSEPNMQNLVVKKHDLFARAFVPSVSGWQFIQADFSNLEVRVMAYVIGDDALTAAVEAGNVHDENTKILFQIPKDHPTWKAARRAAKIFMFGGLAYGGGDREIYEKVILEAPELNLTFARFVAAKSRWMEAHPRYVEWREGIAAVATSTRRVVSPFGRLRVLTGSPRDIVKEALNFPIQSGAASIINAAMTRIHTRRAPTHRMLLQIHDALLFEVEPTALHDTVKMIRSEMEAPVVINNREVTFPVDVEVGPSWGDLKAYVE